MGNTISVLVVDPMEGGPALVANVCQLLARGCPCPLLVYTAMTPASAHVMVALGRQGLCDIVLTPYEDTPERFARTLRWVTTTTHDVPLADAHA
ncbi:MAG TPA: hypothetical protein VNU46_04795 [Gemmatimonadaceae bacterium]|nr:hypothetical protein [Gemmatimonadaceae bacterium]